MTPTVRTLRRTAAAMAAGLLAAMLTACAGTPQSAPAPAGGAAAGRAAAAKPAVNRLVFIAEPPQRSSVEMRQIAEPNMWMFRAMYDDPISIDPKTAKFAPGVAAAWNVEPDGQSYRVKLRPGLKFHGDYGEVQAQDLVFALQRLVIPDSPHGQSNYFRTLVKDADVVNDHEVVFRLNRPDGQFVAALSEQQSGLEAQSRLNFEKTGVATWQTGPLAGSGPYQWLKGEEGQYLRFARVGWTHGFRTQPDFPEYEVRYAREASTRLAALLSGEAHMAPLPTDLLQQAEKAGMKVQTSVFPGLRLFGEFKCCFFKDPKDLAAGVMYPDSPLMDVRVRKALQKAVNTDEVNKAYFGGLGQPMVLPHMHPTRPGWNPDWEKRYKDEYGYDPNEAKALLAQAGKPSPKVTFLLTPIAGVGLGAADLSETIAGYWRKVGVDVEIDQTDPAITDKLSQQLKYDHHVDFKGTASNIWTGYGIYNSTAQVRGSVEDPDVERLFSQLKGTVDEQKQEALWRQVGEATFKSHMDLHLFWLPVRLAVNPKVVSDWVFPGTITGSWTHVENIKTAK